MSVVDHIAGHTWHGRKGAVENAFRYGIDYVLLDAEALLEAPRLFGRNRTGLASVWDRDHGGARCGLGARDAGRARLARPRPDRASDTAARVGPCVQPGLVLDLPRRAG